MAWEEEEAVKKVRERYLLVKYLLENPKAGPREVAKAIGAKRSTVSDWMNDKDFSPKSEFLADIMQFRASAKGPLLVVGPDRKRTAPVRRRVKKRHQTD